MTRKKWTKLRRQKPHLFGVLPPFEKWNAHERKLMATVGKPRALATMTAYFLGHFHEQPKREWTNPDEYRLSQIIPYGPTPKP
jgi:hypothetical protein